MTFNPFLSGMGVLPQVRPLSQIGANPQATGIAPSNPFLAPPPSPADFWTRARGAFKDFSASLEPMAQMGEFMSLGQPSMGEPWRPRRRFGGRQ